MSGRGEQPEKTGDEQAKNKAESVAVSERIYNEDGEVLGKVRGYEQGGFFISTRDGMKQLSIEIFVRDTISVELT